MADVYYPRDTDGMPAAANHVFSSVTNTWTPWSGASNGYVWDVDTMSWVAMTQPGGGPSTGYETVWLKDVAGNQINPATEDTLAKLNGFDLPLFDQISLGYTGTDLTTVTYKLATNTVAVLTLTYDTGVLTDVART